MQYTLKGFAQTIKILSANVCILFQQPLNISINNTIDCEIRIVVCHKDVYLAINSIITFYKHTNLYFPLYVHDDGSLTSSDKYILKTKIPFVQIISRWDANNEIYKKIYKYPYTNALRSGWQGLKLVDIPLLTNSNKVIIIDSDLFFLNNLTEIKDWVLNNISKNNLFLLDYKHFSELSFSECLINLKIKRMKTPFNSGLLCFHKDSYSIELVEKILKTIQNTLLERIRYDDASLLIKNRHLVEQTSYMLLYSIIPSTPLGFRYAVYPKIKNTRSKIDLKKFNCIHFTGEMPRTTIYSEIFRQYSPRIYFLFKNFGSVLKKLRIL